MPITIEEKQTKKCPGLTSLFVTFDYKPELVDLVKKLDGAQFDKKDKVWEIPVINLQKLLDSVADIDSVEVKLLKDKPVAKSNIRLHKYKTEAFPHQKEAIHFGAQNPRFLLNDAPGLGKTATMIHLAEELKQREKLKHCLVVCGINSLKTNWAKEISKHCDLDSVIIGNKLNKKGAVVTTSVKERIAQLKTKIKEFFVIINIESLRDDDIIKAINTGPNKFDMIVMDEMHKCLSKDTEISSLTGNKLIQDVIPGDYVASYDNGVVMYNRVIDSHKTTVASPMIRFTVQDDNGGEHVVTCTGDHKVFTKNRGYVCAAELTPDDTLDIM